MSTLMRNKLSLEDKIRVINENLCHGLSIRKLAVKFGVGKTQINDILRRKDKLQILYEQQMGTRSDASSVFNNRVAKRFVKVETPTFDDLDGGVDKLDGLSAASLWDDSMPLQQRLAFKTNEVAPKEEIATPTLKSQPLSPTKLKVTRQSTSKPQLSANENRETQATSKEVICLKWNTHHSNMQTVFPTLLSKEQYCDVTLVAEGKSLKCHKLILCSCSSYFDRVLENIMPYQHPVIFIKDVSFDMLKALCDFMYAGEVNIVQGDLEQLLAVAESLQVKGLANTAFMDTPGVPQTKTEEKTKEIPQKTTKATFKSSISEKKNASKNGDVTDPLDLMEPTYEEAATPDIPRPVLKKTEQTRRSATKRVRKRKHIEDDHEPYLSFQSPPIFRTRKGTRSRPNIKVPRYFNASFDNSLAKTPVESAEVTQTTEPTYMDPLLDILEVIKTEPLDIDDGEISYGEETFEDTLPELPETVPEYVPPPTPHSKRPKLDQSTKSNTTNQENEDRWDPLVVGSNEEKRKGNNESTIVNSEEDEVATLVQGKDVVDIIPSTDAESQDHQEVSTLKETEVQESGTTKQLEVHEDIAIEEEDDETMDPTETQDDDTMNQIDAQDDDTMNQTEAHDDIATNLAEAQDDDTMNEMEAEGDDTINQIELQEVDTLNEMETQENSNSNQIETQEHSDLNRIEMETQKEAISNHLETDYENKSSHLEPSEEIAPFEDISTISSQQSLHNAGSNEENSSVVTALESTQEDKAPDKVESIEQNNEI